MTAFPEDAKWDRRFMLLAHHVAGWSKESGRRVGAVIVGADRTIRSTGFNGFPRGVDDDVPARHARATGEKYRWSSHAERNAIYNAARAGTPLAGCAIYVPWYPCVECAKAIIQSGIALVVAYPPEEADPRWAPDFALSRTMFAEAGVDVRLIAPLMPLESGAEPEANA